VRAEEALRIGLVQEVVAPGEQLDCANAIAQVIAAQAPLAVQGSLANARVARSDGPAAERRSLVELRPHPGHRRSSSGAMVRLGGPASSSEPGGPGSLTAGRMAPVGPDRQA
jgi:hypothetical protein